MNRLIDSKSNYTTKYAGLVMEADRLRARQENLLTAIVKDAQTSDEGIDIKELGIKVELDGYEGHLVYAIRTVSEEGYSDCLELKVTTTGYESDIEWLSIYDFYSDTAIKVLSEIMENL
jgi:hypothetical protein